MLQDWCTWDEDYNAVVQGIRSRLAALASSSQEFTTVLMQGSGTFSVEACIGTALPPDGKLLVLTNGHYGERMALIAQRLGIALSVLDFSETGPIDLEVVERKLRTDAALTHMAVVHCETTTGMLNPLYEIGEIAARHGCIFIVDAMSSFGGIPLDMKLARADYLVSSANKCIQGTPGFGYVVAQRAVLAQCPGQARSLSLDLYAQWLEMEQNNGKWRTTSPTHVVRAFAQALDELEEEGGIAVRHARYRLNHHILVQGMRDLGFSTLLPNEHQSPIITAFHSPTHPAYDFQRFYRELKSRGFVIYPGKITTADTFRIGNIGHVFPDDIRALLQAVQESRYWL